MATHVCDECVILREKKQASSPQTDDEKQKLTQEKKMSAEFRCSKCFQLYLGFILGLQPVSRDAQTMSAIHAS